MKLYTSLLMTWGISMKQTIHKKIKEAKVELMVLGVREDDPKPRLYTGLHPYELEQGAYWFHENKLWKVMEGGLGDVAEPLWIFADTQYAAHEWCEANKINYRNRDIKICSRPEKLRGWHRPLYYIMIGKLHQIPMEVLRMIDRIDSRCITVEMDARTPYEVLSDLEVLKIHHVLESQSA